MAWGDWERWVTPLVLVALAIDRWVHKQPATHAQLQHQLDLLKQELVRLHKKASDYGASLTVKGDGFGQRIGELDRRLAVVEVLIDRRKGLPR